jgi:mannose-6-phosphate isomerase-like protein (cupin superfamily)
MTNEETSTEPRPRARIFKYAKPQFDGGKRIVKLARTDRMLAHLQVVKEGGENNLHSHSHMDGFWMVLKGRARFYGEADALIGDLGPLEGILVPRGFPYWFESAGNEDLEILQVEAFDIAIKEDRELMRDRTNHAPMTQRERPGEHFMHDATKS